MRMNYDSGGRRCSRARHAPRIGVVCLLLAGAFAVFAIAAGIVPGDINGDSSVNSKDLTRLMKYLSGEDVAVQNETVDTNGDGTVNSKDLTRLMRALSGENVVLSVADPAPAEGIEVSSFVYGKSERGRDLVCYSLSEKTYDKTVLLNFAIHGFEDDYDHDGQVLVDVAKALIAHYTEADSLYGTRLLIVPSANPDGLLDGETNNGFGRCNADGVDLNRDFDANYTPYSSARNYTPSAFSAAESRALRDLCLAQSPAVVIDFHGWLNTTIGDSELAEVFYDELGLSHQVSFTKTNCSGYFSNWAHQNGALALLVEFRDTSIDQTALIRAVDRLLNGGYDNGEGEYAADERYAEFTGVQAYTLSEGRTDTYRGFNQPFDSASYIDGAADLCVIDRIYQNGWVKVTYPVASGQKTAYCGLSAFIGENAVTPYSSRVTDNTKVYRRSDLSETIGSVWSTDTFYVVAETGRLKQIIYPLDNGGWKMGWISQ